MKQDNEEQVVVYKPKLVEKNKISFVWILPFVIFCILGWIAYEAYTKKGTNITIIFNSAEGLKENITPLEYKGLQLGKVTKIEMHENLQSVKVNVLVDNDVAKYVANESSSFWIKKPTVSLTKVSGLNTLITGYKIELSPRFRLLEEYAKSIYKDYFIGLDSQPNDEFELNGYYVNLISSSDKDNIEIGTPIFYNKFQIGEIVAKEFRDEKVFLVGYIYDKFNHLVNKSSKFIMNEALKVNYGASGLNIELGSVYSALVGGITVITSSKDDKKIEGSDSFEIYASKDDLRAKEYFTINFTDTNGITKNTPIIFKGIEIGKITQVELDKDVLSTKAFVYDEYKYLLTNKTRFFVEVPTISLEGVKNLANVIKGNFISLDYQDGEFATTFMAVPKQDLNKSLNNIKIELLSENLNSITKKSKVFYKNIPIGIVDNYVLTKDLKNIKITLLIDSKYKDLLNDNSLFYDMSSKLVELKNLNLSINYSGVEPLLDGAIGLISQKRDDIKLTKKEFTLYNSYKEVTRLKRFYNTGTNIEAFFDNSFEVKQDMAIVYKNQEIGFVRDVKFDDTTSKATIFIYAPFKQYITSKSRFYKKAAVDLKASLSGVLFEINNFNSLIEGSIVMDTNSSQNLSKYQIYANEESMKNSTSSLTIIFDDVEGLQENFSKLTYKGVNIGKVKKISLNKNQQIEVNALIYDDFSSFAKEGTVFYLKKPRISFQEVANIGSTIMAVNIGVVKSTSQHPQTVFKGSVEQDSFTNSHFGTVYKVEDATASSVAVDAPVYYKNVRIGKVSKVDLSSDGSKVIFDCLIYDKYKKLIRKNSQFYDISGFEMEFSIFGGSKVESNTFASLIKGGLVVVTPYDYGEMATIEDRFTLNKTLREDWKTISPSIK